MFERYLGAQTHRSTGKRVLIALSVLLHLVVVALVIIWSFFHVAEVTPPPLTVTFFTAAAPPPPPPPPPPAGRKTATPKMPRPPVVQPTEVKPLVQPKTPEPVEDDQGDDDEDGVEGGVVGGVKGGVVGGVIGGAVGGVKGGVLGDAPPPPPVKPKNVPAHTLDAQVVFRPTPHLPQAVLLQHRNVGELVFVAKVCIDREGKVFEINVIQGIAGGDDAVLSTVRQWRYKPQPIPVCFIANWVFTVE